MLWRVHDPSQKSETVMTRRRAGILLLAFVAVVGVFVVEVRTDPGRALLDDFESGSIRIVQPGQSQQQFKLLWNQYPSDPDEGPDPGSASISSTTVHDGTKSLKITVTGGNIYMSFYPNDGSKWHRMREYILPASDWRTDTFNRMRFWVKVPSTFIAATTPGLDNIQFGTYIEGATGDGSSAEVGGDHYYHYLNIPYTGEWHQVIIDTHPSHRRNDPGDLENGNLLYPTGQAGYNYFDGLTRFYFDAQGAMTSVPADFYFDGFELYKETNPENVDQIYSLNGVYIPSSNKVRVGWNRNKNENSVKHEVRYSFDDVFRTGWQNAIAAPGGLITPPGFGGYNLMSWETTAINVTGKKIIYIAIKPQNSTLFRQIAIPLTSTGGSAPAAPSGLHIQ